MAGAILGGVLKAGLVAPDNIYVSDIDSGKANAMAALGVSFSQDNARVFENADVVILAVKPDAYPSALAALGSADAGAQKLLISIAPGITIADIKSYLGRDAKVIRTMPNTPAMVGEGMTILCGEAPADENDFLLCEKIFGAVGKTARLPEKLMNAAVALNGSSPAYVFMFIEAMADAAVGAGIPRAFACEAAAQAVLGSAKMVLETKIHPGQLKDMVCSPGGTTIEAVKVLEEKGFRAGIIAAMDACTEKTKRMAAK